MSIRVRAIPKTAADGAVFVINPGCTFGQIFGIICQR